MKFEMELSLLALKMLRWEHKPRNTEATFLEGGKS